MTYPQLVPVPRYNPPGGWNDQFQAVFRFVTNGSGHGCIEAVAGSGKTTALVEAIIQYLEKHSSHRVLFVAFNVSIKEEGAKRLAGYNCDVLTCHGLGFRSLRKSPWNKGKTQFDVQDSYGPYMTSLAEAEIGPEKEKADDREALMDLISKAKTTLVDDVPSLIELMNRFGIVSSYLPQELAEKALNIINITANRPGTTFIARKGKGFSKAAITFDDEIWLPIVNNWPVDQYDAVFVDECQDLSPARRELVKRALKPEARIFVCGDKMQAIYSWAGADIDSLPTLVKEFDCTTLPLSFSWRCDASIIQEARQFNPKIEARPNADIGIVDNCKYTDLLDSVKTGDVIISRTNAPLVKLFFQLAKKQRKVKFIGRDYGRMLSYRIRGWRFHHEAMVSKGNASGDFTGRTLLNSNDNWLDVQLDKNKNKTLHDRWKDEHATIISLTEDLSVGLDSKEAVKEILDRCFAFSPDENPKDKDGAEYITLSSTHRFKGLERSHVYCLIDTYNPGDNQEETNLVYVAVTRAKRHLTYVSRVDR